MGYFRTSRDGLYPFGDCPSVLSLLVFELFLRATRDPLRALALGLNFVQNGRSFKPVTE